MTGDPKTLLNILWWSRSYCNSQVGKRISLLAKEYQQDYFERASAALYHLVLACAILCHFVCSCAIFCHLAPSCVILCVLVPPCAILCHLVPSCAILCALVPPCAALCHFVPPCAILCHLVPFLGVVGPRLLLGLLAQFSLPWNLCRPLCREEIAPATS